MVIASLKMPSPKTMENNFGNFLDEIASSDAMVSILQKQAPSNKIYQTDNYLIEFQSLASRTKSESLNRKFT